jgi:hypothetical protein
MLRADNTTYPSTSTVLLYLLHWVFDSEGYARLATPEELDIQISLGAKDQEIDIKQRSCTTFHRTLGVDENPAGIYKTEYTHIVTKGQKYLPKWVYIFPVCALHNLPTTSFTQLDLATILCSLIYTMGFN